MLCTIALLKHIQIPSDISFGIYLREPRVFNLATFRLKNTKEKMILRSSLLSQSVSDSEPYDSFVE